MRPFPEGVQIGSYSGGTTKVDVVSVDASALGVRIFVRDSPGLCGFFASIEPPALAAVVLVALHRGKHAIEPLPDFMPMKRDGWLMDASGGVIKLWCAETQRSVGVKPQPFFAVAELYARLALWPWEGLLPAPAGGDLTGRAPAWVDGLRLAHVELLRVLRKGAIEPLQQGGKPIAVEQGRYRFEHQDVHLTSSGLVLNQYLVAELMAGRLDLELPALLEAILDQKPYTLPSLPVNMGGRKPIELAPRSEGVEIQVDGASRVVGQLDLMRLVELDLRHVLAGFAEQRIAQDKRPDTGAPPWVGRGRAVWGRAVGRLLFDRFQRVVSSP